METDIKPDVTITDLPDASPSDPLEALSWLGETVEEVAEGLRARGIKGKLGDGDNCPLANYLHEWWSGAWVAMGKWARQEQFTAEGICPEPVAKFERQFDNNRFPDLIDSNG